MARTQAEAFINHVNTQMTRGIMAIEPDIAPFTTEGGARISGRILTRGSGGTPKVQFDVDLHGGLLKQALEGKPLRLTGGSDCRPLIVVEWQLEK